MYDCLGDVVTNPHGKWAGGKCYRVRTAARLACSGNGGTSVEPESLLNGAYGFLVGSECEDTNTDAQYSLCVSPRSWMPRNPW